MLGDVASARAEFAQLSPVARQHPEALEHEWSLLAAAQAWTEAFATAQRLVDLAPDQPFGWVHRAFALRRMPGGGLPQAWNALRPAHDRFPNDMLIAYNLACYAAQLKRPDEAWDWLQRAFANGGKEVVLKLAFADDDLRPLWPRLKEEEEA